jgi:hypothetical protein
MRRILLLLVVALVMAAMIAAEAAPAFAVNPNAGNACYLHNSHQQHVGSFCA